MQEIIIIIIVIIIIVIFNLSSTSVWYHTGTIVTHPCENTHMGVWNHTFNVLFLWVKRKYFGENLTTLFVIRSWNYFVLTPIIKDFIMFLSFSI